jgi:phytoene synthase
MPTDASETLPLPFYDRPWKGTEREAAHAFWAWHQGLAGWAETRHSTPLDVGKAREAAAAGQSFSMLPDATSEAAYAACDAFGLPRVLLARQIAPAVQMRGPVQFERYVDLAAFIDDWAAPHARLLGKLGGLTLRAHEPLLNEMARGIFLTRCMVRLPQDLSKDRLFLSLEELEQAGVTVQQIREGSVDESVRKLMWRRSVRARDALGQAQPLVRDLTRRRYRWAFKRVWLGTLEVLAQVKQQDYDVWSEPVTLPRWARWQVRLQALVGRASFR